MAGAGRDQVQNIEQEVPKFIREFRERTGQAGKEVVDINSKRRPIQNEDEEGDSDEERPEEAPLICVEEGVSEEEAYSFTKEKFGEKAVEKSELKRKLNDEDSDNGTPEQNDGKFVFKKPTKDRDVSRTKNKSKDKGKSDMPKVKNKTLLSFGDEEEGDDDYDET